MSIEGEHIPQSDSHEAHSHLTGRWFGYGLCENKQNICVDLIINHFTKAQADGEFVLDEVESDGPGNCYYWLKGYQTVYNSFLYSQQRQGVAGDIIKRVYEAMIDKKNEPKKREATAGFFVARAAVLLLPAVDRVIDRKETSHQLNWDDEIDQAVTKYFALLPKVIYDSEGHSSKSFYYLRLRLREAMLARIEACQNMGSEDLSIEGLTGLSDEQSQINTAEQSSLAHEIARIMGKLSERERQIISLLHELNDEERMSPQEVANKFQITEHRVHVIEGTAMQKLRHQSSRRRLRNFLVD